MFYTIPIKLRSPPFTKKITNLNIYIKNPLSPRYKKQKKRKIGRKLQKKSKN